MAKLTATTISKRTVEAISVEKDTVFWDSELLGFGVRAYPSGSRYYIVQTRAAGKAAKRVTVGRHGVVTAEEARRRAALIIARIKAGEEPAAEPLEAGPGGGPTVGDLARRWMEEHVAVRCKPRTARMYRLILDKHLLPALGRTPALALTHERVAALHHSMRATPSMANRTLDVLSRLWNAAEDRGRVPEASNPCRHAVRFRERRRERFLSDGEFRRLGRALSEAEGRKGVSVHAVAAIRLLLLTGCRRNEILTLRWRDVDLDARELDLADSKTGRRTVSLSPEAAAVLAGIPRIEGKPVRDPGEGQGRAHAQPERPLAGDLRTRGDRGHAASRLPSLVRVQGAGAGRGAADDRAAPRPQPGGNHRALRASRPGLGARRGGARLRQHRRRHLMVSSPLDILSGYGGGNSAGAGGGTERNRIDP